VAGREEIALNRSALALTCALAALVAAPRVVVADPVVERAVAAHLDQLRAIKPGGDAKAIERSNAQMDEAWKYYTANSKEALPVLRKALAAEIARDKRADLLLLDVGYFLLTKGAPEDKDLARSALFALDPSAEIVRWNANQLFYFAHAVAASHDSRVLPFIDKAFLRGNMTVDVPQHAMTLDGTLTCVLLYGVYGKESEEHLRPALADAKTRRKAIEILIWIGSPRSNAAVRDAMLEARDYETFTRFMAFMMQDGGPEGRAIALAVDPGHLDGKAREYYGRVRPSVEKAGRDEYLKLAEHFPGERKLPDDEVKRRLKAMRANFGKDESTNPGALLESGLPKEYLIGEFIDIRALMFNRVSNEALSDVETTNAVLNGLRYRGH
jgi:hypothetical protein